MRWYVVIVLLLVMLNISFSQEDNIDDKVEETLEKSETVPVIVIVKDKEKTQDVISDVNTESKLFGIIKEETKNLEVVGEFSLIAGFYGNITKEGLEKLKKDPNVLKVEFDTPFKAHLQDSIKLVNASATHSLEIKNTNITGMTKAVCIVDTGINLGHPDLTGKVLDGYNYINNNNAIFDNNGHGTHVAGIAAASGGINGIAKGANLISIKALDANGIGSSSNIIAGMEWCMLNATIYNITVISLSLGSSELFTDNCDTEFPSFAAAVNNAVMRNITVVVSAGNNNSNNAISAPACLSNATAVGSTDKSNQISSFSNRNKLVSLFATGSIINSTDRDETYSNKSGTSMSAPHVAGAVALLQQYKNFESNIELTPTEVIDALNKTGYKFREGSNTYSLIQISKAVESIDTKPPDLFDESRTNVVLNNTNIEFFINASDTFMGSVWIGINFSNNFQNFTTNNLNGKYNFTLNSSSFNSKDNISWRFYANDSNGNLASSTFNSLIVKTINITLQNPINNTFTNSNQTNFNFIAVDPGDNSFSCSLFIDDNLIITNATTLNNTLTDFTANTNESRHSWNIECGNPSKYIETSNKNFITVDLTLPIVNLTYPLNNSNLTKLDNFTFSLVELNPSICSLQGNFNSSDENITSGINQFSGLNLSIGSYNWNVECSDKAGNINKLNNFTFNIVEKTQSVIGNISNSNINNLNITIDNSTDLNKVYDGVRNVIIKSGNETIIEFDYDFDNDILNLSGITLERQISNDSGSVLIRGLNNHGSKTVYLDNLNQNEKHVCIRDEEILSISEITNDCTGNNEFIVKCSGSNGNYSCEDLGSKYKINGLTNSGVTEFFVQESSGNTGGSSGGSSSGGSSSTQEVIEPEEESTTELDVIKPSVQPVIEEAPEEIIEEETRVPEITAEVVLEVEQRNIWYFGAVMFILVTSLVIWRKGYYKILPIWK